MKFTVVGPVYPYRGGIAHYTSQLILALEKAGHTVQVVSFSRQYPQWLYPGKSDKDPSKINWRISARYTLDPINPLTWRGTVNMIKQQKPDLVIIQWWTTFFAPVYAYFGWLLKRINIKAGFIIHNVLPHEQRFFDPYLAKMALSAGHFFIAQTDIEKKRLLQLLPDRNVTVCHLPTYTFLTDRKVPKEEARQKIGFPLSQPFILFFGIVRPYKGLKILLDSMAILKKNYSARNPFLLVAGEIWENKEEYLEQINNLNLEDCVRLDDRYIPDEEAAVIFSAADMLVAPYINGTQSAAVGLALGFDLPVIMTEVVAVGVSEENKQISRVVKNGDAEDLARAMQDEINNPIIIHPGNRVGEGEWQRLISTLEELI